MAHSEVNLLNEDDFEGFDDADLERAIRQSLANTDLQPTNCQPKPYWNEDDDLQRALAESMRTFEAEQQGGPAATRKRSSSDDAIEGQQQPQQDHTSVVQQPAEVQQQQQPAAGGALKRQRSISTPGSCTAGLEDLAGQQPQHTVSAHAPGGRLMRLGHGAVLITTSLQPQHQPLGIPQANGLQCTASLTNAPRLQPWPCSGVLQLQPQQWGMGRSASAQDLQAFAAQPAGSGDLAGSRPSSPAHAGQQQQYDRVPGSSVLDMPDLEADEEDDAVMDVANSNDSMSSGLANTVSSWGPALLQAAPPAAAQQRLIGAWPVPDDLSEWRIHDRLFYEGQSIYWQQYKNGNSYAGRVMTVEGGGRSPALYMVEIHQHPQGLQYVEAVAAQLHPQLRIGDMVWCKPAAVKKACWSGHGPLYWQLHPANQPWASPQPCQDAPWRMGVVRQVQLYDWRHPLAELRIVGTGGSDTCWFRVAQLELIREIGESSAAAERRAAGNAAAAAEAAAEQAQGGAVEEVDLTADEQQSLQQQQQQQQSQQLHGEAAAAAARDDDDALLQLAAASDQNDLEDLLLTGGEPSTLAAAEEQLEAADGQPGLSAEVSPDPDAAAAPSLLSHPAAALTGESELDADAPAVTVDQAADAVQPMQQQLHRPAAAAPAHPASVQPAGKEADQQQEQQQPAVLEGTGESAEALMVQEVVGDSFAGGMAEGVEAAPEGPQGAAPSPKEPLSNQHSGVEDSSMRPGQEGFGET